jgi:alkanesulfonate monooxygenase SsuD/methylene tetrahydromethanopterin reductase-like flavin-dependent oxidoreductase (luciferase family)
MKYGVFLPNFTPFSSARIIADLARDAEQSGWDGFFLWDEMAGFEAELVDPWIALAAAALTTERVKLGALVTPIARRRPWKLARETVTLDHLSNGRLILGVGTGGGDAAYGDLGEEPDGKVRGDMLDEALAVLTGLWSAQPFQYEGKHYHIKKAHFRPGPFQQPRIPVWVGGIWPHKRPLRRMAQWDGMFPLFFGAANQEEELTHLRQWVAEVSALRGGNLQGYEVVTVGITPLEAPDQARAKAAAYQAAGATWWLEGIDPFPTGDYTAEPVPFDRLRQRVLAGPPR